MIHIEIDCHFVLIYKHIVSRQISFPWISLLCCLVWTKKSCLCHHRSAPCTQKTPAQLLCQSHSETDKVCQFLTQFQLKVDHLNGFELSHLQRKPSKEKDPPTSEQYQHSDRVDIFLGVMRCDLLVRSSSNSDIWQSVGAPQISEELLGKLIATFCHNFMVIEFNLYQHKDTYHVQVE